MPPLTAASAHDLVRVLPKSAKEKSLTSALYLHVVASKLGLETHTSTASYLASLFAESERICYAQQIIDKLPYPDPSCWNALILGYSRPGKWQQTLDIFHEVQGRATSHLNEYALLSLLKASASVNDLTTGIAIHSHVVKLGLLKENPYIGSTLVDMYAKCGSIDEARQVFDVLLEKDAVTWTAMLAGHIECGFNKEALDCFEKMQSEGIHPDAFSYASSLKACGRLCNLGKGRALHLEIVERGFEESDAFVGSVLVDMYARCGSLSEANAVFSKLQLRNVVSWTALIAGFVECGLSYEAIYYFEMMHQECISPSVVSFICILKSCAAVGVMDLGLKIHIELVKMGFERELIVNNSLIDMYAKCGFLDEARQGFDKLSVRNVVSCNALLAGYVGQGQNDEVALVCNVMDLEGISPNAVTFAISLRVCCNTKATSKGQQIHSEISKRGLLVEGDDYICNALIDMYAKCGLLEDAEDVLARLSAQNVISWTAIIQGYAEYGGVEEALRCLEQMQEAGIAPGVITFVCCLRACSTICAFRKGQGIHAQIAKQGLEDEPFIGNFLVYLYSKCDMLAAAEQLFIKLQVVDIVSCNALITGYAQLGESEIIFRIFDKMIHDQIKPDLVTFVCVLNACSHEGKVEKGEMYFEAMAKYCGLSPSLNHYACMVDLYGRSGSVDAAKIIISRMPLQPGMVVWHTMMAACRKWGYVELARFGFEQALQLDSSDDSAYVYMLNIYLDAEMHEAASRVDTLRRVNRKLLDVNY